MGIKYTINQLVLKYVKNNGLSKFVLEEVNIVLIITAEPTHIMITRLRNMAPLIFCALLEFSGILNIK